MTDHNPNQLGKTLWAIADKLRGAMNADDFRDYMLSFLFLRYLSDNYEDTARKELASDYPSPNGHVTGLQRFYEENEADIPQFEEMMRAQMYYIIPPNYLWGNISALARRQDEGLLSTLREGFKHIEEKSFGESFRGLFSEINLDSEKLGRTYADRNDRLCTIISEISKGLENFRSDKDTMGDAYEYLIGQFAAGGGRKAGEFYTPQEVSSILSRIVALDSHNPETRSTRQVKNVLDFACGSGSLLLNVRNKQGTKKIGKIYGQESNITTYNLARMNMLLHGLQSSEFEIHHGDTLKNDWDILREENPTKKLHFDAVVANPPFSLRWEPAEEHRTDIRFKDFGVAPRSAADFAFLLHGLHYLSEDGVMAIIMPHGVLFRGGAEERIRRKLLEDRRIDAVIGLPSNLFYSTGIPVCILVLKKCTMPDNLLFINASEHFEKGKRQNTLRSEDIERIVDAYQQRKELERFSRTVPMKEIADNDYNLNISRYLSTAETEPEIKLQELHKELLHIEAERKTARDRHNEFLKELGLAEVV